MVVTFDEYNKKELELEKYKNMILKLIDEFIILHKDEFSGNQCIEFFNNSFDYGIDHQHGGSFDVQFFYGTWNRQYDLHFTREQYKNLLEFMKNPEMYKSVHKYNL